MNYLREETKTIAALATAPITQNIAIIRVSGPLTYQIVQKVFDKKIPSYDSRPNIFLGRIVSKKDIIDQVLLFCFYKPFSFTGEDVIEISCHGNLLIVNKILSLLLGNGAQLAQPGEFSKQAFFNGKLNLIQTDAINDLIRSNNLSTTKLAIQNFDQKRAQKLFELEEKLLEIIAHIEINIDYPEYDDFEIVTIPNLILKTEKILNEIRKIRINSKKLNLYEEGIKVGIFGRPNVGKSTLLNSLLGEEKAIVSPISGTTRDIIEAKYFINEIPIILFDTAGIRNTKNQIERQGILKSQNILKDLDLAFLVLDSSKKWTKLDDDLYQLVSKKKHLIILNKVDLDRKVKIPNYIQNCLIVEISAKSGEISSLESKFSELFKGELIDQKVDYPFLSHSWQQSRLQLIEKKLEEVLGALENKIPVDIVISDLQIAFRLVRELSGKDYDEDLLDIIFSRYCLGK